MQYYLYVLYSRPTVVQLELSTLCGAPLASSKLFNCFTIAVYCRPKVVTIFTRKPCFAINFHKTVVYFGGDCLFQKLFMWWK